MATESTKTTNGHSDTKHEETRDAERLRDPSPGEKEAEKPEDTDVSAEADDDASGDIRAGTAATAAPAPTGGFAAGAAAVVSAGLGLCSLTGTALGDMLRARKELMGQIEASTGGGGGDQIGSIYSAPWDTTALLNGFFAFIAVVVGGALLAVHAKRADTHPWVKAVALGGVALGALGLIVAGGMYLDLFASKPELPAAPPTPPAP